MKEKIKLCPFCEGSVALEAEECRYCGSSLMKVGVKVRAPYQTEESLAGLYDPPYSPERSRLGIETVQEEEEEVVEQPAVRAVIKEDAEEGNRLGAILLLSLGGQLFTLAWLLLFFSDQGRVSLEWASKYWPVYLGLSVVMLYQGWKKVQ